MAPPIREDHLRTVLSLLLRHPGATRPQLCAWSGLAPSAMHAVVGRLVERGVAQRVGEGASTGGRRAGQYRLRGDLGSVMGVSLRVDRLAIGLFDMNMRPMAEAHRAVALDAMGPESYVALVAEMAANLLAESGAAGDCFGVGVTVPGPVRYAEGVVEQICGAPLWEDFPLARRLSEALKLPVLADKDVYAGIEYLGLTGQVRRPACAAYLSICEGIGTALMLDGRAFRGGHSLSGELGHLTVRKDGIPCRCGNVGCLELYCSDIGLVKQYNAQSGGSARALEDVLDRMDGGDEIAAKVISQAIGYLVDTTSSIIMAYDPCELFIFCRWLNRRRTLYFKMLDVVYARSVFTRKHRVDIRLLPPEPIHLPAAASVALTSLMLRPEGKLMGRLR